MNDLKPQEKTNKKLCINSAFVSSSWVLDIYDKIDVHNHKRVIVESISINSMLMRFYEMKNVKPFGIISAYIWDTENREIIEYITDLPDNDKKALLKARRIHNIQAQQKRLAEELEKLQ